MQFMKPKKKDNRLGIVILVLVALMIAGLALGGTTFTFQVLKNYVVGVAIGAAVYLVLMLLKRKSSKKTNILNRFR